MLPAVELHVVSSGGTSTTAATETIESLIFVLLRGESLEDLLRIWQDNRCAPSARYANSIVPLVTAVV